MFYDHIFDGGPDLASKNRKDLLRCIVYVLNTYLHCLFIFSMLAGPVRPQAIRLIVTGEGHVSFGYHINEYLSMILRVPSKILYCLFKIFGAFLMPFGVKNNVMTFIF